MLILLLITSGGASSQRRLDNEKRSEWKLVFADDFDAFDDRIWDTATHTFENNAARFRPENISYRDGKMILRLKPEITQDRKFTGAELRTNNVGGSYTYGRFVVRMKAARGSAVVSSFFTFRYNPWQEIDIEFLGKDTTKIHFNIFHNQGAAGATNNRPNQSPVIIDLGFDAAADFHEYAFEWAAKKIRWYVDGKAVFESPMPERVPNLPQQIMMNLWVTTSSDWAGAIDERALPTQAEYDYVRFYQKK